MTQEEAIRRASILLRRFFHNDIDNVAIVVVAEAEKDTDTLSSALEQIISTCEGLKKGLMNKD